jgi:Tol biopolymer transport system component
MHDVETPPFPAYVGDEPYLFVCYSHANKIVVYAELQRLKASGAHVWYDEGIVPGSEWTDELAEAIRGCAKMLFYVSPASVASRVCRDEVQLALTHHKPLVAIHLESTELPSGLELALGRTQAIFRYALKTEDYERKLMAAAQTTIQPPPKRMTGPDVTTAYDGRTESRRWAVLSLVVMLIVAAAVMLYSMAGVRTPRIVGEYRQVTTSRVLFPPTPSAQPLLTDGPRIYFNEWREGDFWPREVSVSGGESVAVDVPANLPHFIQAVAPDLSELVIGSYSDSKRWFWSPVGGSPRQFAQGHGTTWTTARGRSVNVIQEGHSISWTPDGTKLVNAVMGGVYVANGDGSEPHLIATNRVHPGWARISPDGKVVRFTDWPQHYFQIYEVSADGSGLHQMFADRSDFTDVCCGSWTPDGRHYVFQATRNGQSHLWVLNEGDNWLRFGKHEPTQLTTGAMQFNRPLISTDGKKLFAVGWIQRGELMRVDSASNQIVPHFGARSVEWVAYSPDGRNVAYVTYPEGDLWVSDADGSHPIRLTTTPMHPWDPVWAPDGKTIAFSASVGISDRSGIYLVGLDGSAPQLLRPADHDDAWPSWTSDGRFIVLSSSNGLHQIDLETKRETAVPGGTTFGAPKVSPDGRHLTALAFDPTRIMRFEFATGRWDELAPAPDANRQMWSRDGRYVYYFTEDPALEVFRVDVADRSVQRVVSFLNERWVWGAWSGGFWAGIAADGSLLFLRNQSVHHIYALDWEA